MARRARERAGTATAQASEKPASPVPALVPDARSFDTSLDWLGSNDSASLTADVSGSSPGSAARPTESFLDVAERYRNLIVSASKALSVDSLTNDQLRLTASSLQPALLAIDQCAPALGTGNFRAWADEGTYPDSSALKAGLEACALLKRVAKGASIEQSTMDKCKKAVQAVCAHLKTLLLAKAPPKELSLENFQLAVRTCFPDPNAVRELSFAEVKRSLDKWFSRKLQCATIHAMMKRQLPEHWKASTSVDMILSAIEAYRKSVGDGRPTQEDILSRCAGSCSTQLVDAVILGSYGTLVSKMSLPPPSTLSAEVQQQIITYMADKAKQTPHNKETTIEEIVQKCMRVRRTPKISREVRRLLVRHSQIRSLVGEYWWVSAVPANVGLPTSRRARAAATGTPRCEAARGREGREDRSDLAPRAKRQRTDAASSHEASTIHPTRLAPAERPRIATAAPLPPTVSAYELAVLALVDRARQETRPHEPSPGASASASACADPTHTRPGDVLRSVQVTDRSFAPQTVLSASRFVRQPNPGDGNCLLHALEGRTLPAEEAYGLRLRMAQLAADAPDAFGGPALNAMRLATALQQRASTSLPIEDLVQGLELPNRLHAEFLALDGHYLGYEDIALYCRLHDAGHGATSGRSLRVTVATPSGELVSVSAQGETTIRPANQAEAERAVQRAFERADVVIFHQGGHFERALGFA